MIACIVYVFACFTLPMHLGCKVYYDMAQLRGGRSIAASTYRPPPLQAMKVRRQIRFQMRVDASFDLRLKQEPNRKDGSEREPSRYEQESLLGL